MSCNNCENADACGIDFVTSVAALRKSLADLRQQSEGGVLADNNPALTKLLGEYPVCVQLAVIDINFQIGKEKFKSELRH